jgi:hypothetical protein
MLRIVKLITAGMMLIVALCSAAMPVLACGGGDAGTQTASGDSEKK